MHLLALPTFTQKHIHIRIVITPPSLPLLAPLLHYIAFQLKARYGLRNMFSPLFTHMANLRPPGTTKVHPFEVFVDKVRPPTPAPLTRPCLFRHTPSKEHALADTTKIKAPQMTKPTQLNSIHACTQHLGCADVHVPHLHVRFTVRPNRLHRQSRTSHSTSV